MTRLDRIIHAALLLAFFAGFAMVKAHAQAPGVVTLTPSVTSCSVKCTPTLTWSTTPAAQSCSAPWTTKTTASGSQALAEITKTTNYSMTCAWPGSVQSITVTYVAPTQNTDDTPLTDLANFKVLYGTSATSLNTGTKTVPGTETSITFTPPSAGTWFAAVRAINSKGAESDNSNVTSRTVTSTAPTASGSATVTVEPAPKPPTGATATVALANLNVPLDSLDGFKRAPVFTITTSGLGVLAGFVKVGTPITAKVLTYKKQDWCTFIEKHPRTGAPNVAWYGDPRPINSVVAPCA